MKLYIWHSACIAEVSVRNAQGLRTCQRLRSTALCPARGVALCAGLLSSSGGCSNVLGRLHSSQAALPARRTCSSLKFRQSVQYGVNVTTSCKMECGSREAMFGTPHFETTAFQLSVIRRCISVMDG